MTKRYCAAPWRGLHINFRGDVKTCCAGDPNMLGDLNNKSLQEIIHSTKMQEIRASIKQGDLHPEYCYNCIKQSRMAVANVTGTTVLIQNLTLKLLN